PGSAARLDWASPSTPEKPIKPHRSPKNLGMGVPPSCAALFVIQSLCELAVEIWSSYKHQKRQRRLPRGHHTAHEHSSTHELAWRVGGLLNCRARLAPT